jgi:hypothetical protein
LATIVLPATPCLYSFANGRVVDDHRVDSFRKQRGVRDRAMDLAGSFHELAQEQFAPDGRLHDSISGLSCAPGGDPDRLVWNGGVVLATML